MPGPRPFKIVTSSLFYLSLSVFCLSFHYDGTCLYFIAFCILSCYFIVMSSLKQEKKKKLKKRKKEKKIFVLCLFFHAPFVPLISAVSGYNFSYDSNFF